MNRVEEAVNLILNSKKTFALTGAGISTESGIADFRSSTGYYSKMDPMKALSKDVLLLNPERFYSEGYVILEDLQDKKPNKGHIALAELEELGKLSGLITQNIDNLHTKAGSKNVYEVHGHTRTVHCINCNREYPFKELTKQVKNKKIPPKCEVCGGILRPDVVMFGDMMPNDFIKASDELYDTELLIVVGSSLTVSPVNFLPRYVKDLIIINNTKTPEDKRAKVVFNESSGKILNEILLGVKKKL